MSARAIDDRTVEFHRRKGDKEVSRNTLQVSADGNVLTNKFHDATTPNAPPVEGTTTLRRAGPAPAGAHAVSGQWTPERVGQYSEEALNVTYQVAGNRVTSNVQGQSYTAERRPGRAGAGRHRRNVRCGDSGGRQRTARDLHARRQAGRDPNGRAECGRQVHLHY